MLRALGFVMLFWAAACGPMESPPPAPVDAGPQSASLTLDRLHYASTFTPEGCAKWPCPDTAVAGLRFEVRNITRETLEWTFSTTCQLGVEAVALDGRVLRRHVGGACGYAITSLKLEPGQSTTYESGFALVDESGRHLEGLLSLRAFLASDIPPLGPPTSAVAPLFVRVDLR